MNDTVTIENLLIENASLKAELAEVNQKLSWLIEQISSNNRKLYGVSSEKSAYCQPSLFSDAQAGLVTVESAQDVAPSGENESTGKKRPIKRGEMSTRLPDSLPIEVIECELPEDGRNCPQCGEAMRDIGRTLVRKEFKIIPAKAVVTQFWGHAYSCRDCEDYADTVPVIKAPLPPQVIKGAMCAPETIAHIVVEKCVMGSPLHRQEKSWQRNGIPITRQTMANWLIRCSQDYFEPIYTELHRLLLLQTLLYSDDTVLQVLREPGKPPQSESRMWLYRTGADAQNQIILYEYQPDRKKERPMDFLDGFSGYLVCDGYAAYHSLPGNIIVVGCLAHVRSKFVDALKCLKDNEQKGSLALTGKMYCDKLFDIDRDLAGKSFEDRYKVRMAKAAPVLDEFQGWLESVNQYVAKKSKLGQAVTYALNQWKYVIRYLLDGRIECSNNRSERSIKPFVINRKNFLFATSVEGAKAAAVLHSLTETAMENGLNPFEYLTYVLRSACAGNIREDAALLQKLLPHNAPDSCKAMT